MRMRGFAVMLLLALAAGLSGCGRAQAPMARFDTSCAGRADDLKTLREGDELPRVVQVLGMPDRAIRVKTLFYGHYDILEYDVSKSPCTRAVLHADKKLNIVFDGQGQYVGTGGDDYMKYRRAFAWSKTPLTIDPMVMAP